MARRNIRRYDRMALPKGMLVAWQASGKRGVSRVSCIGLGGLYVNTPDPPPVGAIVKLLFEVPNGEVRARAAVRNSEPGKGMGLEFVNLGHEDRGRLRQLMKRLLQ